MDISAFFKQNRMGVCSFVIKRLNGSYERYPSQPCLAALQYVGNTKTIAELWVDLRSKDEQLRPAAEKYWRYLLDPETSPFRLALKDRELLEVDGKLVGVCFKDPSAPLQVIASAAIQLRVPFEHPANLLTFATLTSEGIENWEALFASEYFRTLGDMMEQDANGGWHRAFSTVNGLSITAIRDGKPKMDPMISWINGTQYYYPINDIWSDHKDGAKFLAVVQSDGKYSGAFPALFKAATGAEHHKNGGSIPVKDFIKRLKEGRGQWANN